VADDERMQISRLTTRGLAALLFLGVAVTGASASASAQTSTTSTSATTGATTTTSGSSGGNGITRADLGSARPANAPGQELYLQRVTIAPGAKLPEHYHQGTQVARILAGVLTYDIASGSATVTRKDGSTQTVTAPATVKLRTGDGLVETEGLEHHGSNSGKKPVVIEIASLLQAGAPLSTPVGQGATGTPLHVTADLDSQSRNLHTAGADGSVTYGWNQLVGTATVDGQPVGVELLGNVSYVKGSGPIFGFVTYTFADGSTLGVQFQGSGVASSNGDETTFAATLGVVGGTGRYASATGTGIFTGSRKAALGTTVASTFDLTLTGAS
jgi:quercetin dioxygenase-like cupin family protein